MEAKVDTNNVVASLHSSMKNKDVALKSIFDKIDESTVQLDSDLSTAQKYRIVLSVEFLLFRARTMVETEHINIKSIIADPTVEQTIKGMFAKRDQYLASVSAKITTMTNDISIIEKAVYAEQTIFKN